MIVLAIKLMLFSVVCLYAGPNDNLELAGKHPVVLLPEDSGAHPHIPRRPDTILVENFNHRKNVYVAEIPIDQIKSSYLVATQFAKLPIIRLGHLSVYFEMESGSSVRLYDATSGQTAPELELDGFVYSFNYAAKKGEKYSPLVGLNSKKYLSTHNLKSPKDLKTYVSLNDRGLGKNSTNLIEIDYSASENAALARGLIEQGAAASTTQPYNTACFNCSNVVFDVMDTIKAYSGPVSFCGYHLTKILANSPGRAHHAMAARGLSRGTTPFHNHPKFQRASRGTK